MIWSEYTFTVPLGSWISSEPLTMEAVYHAE